MGRPCNCRPCRKGAPAHLCCTHRSFDGTGWVTALWSKHMDNDRECTARIVDFIMVANVIYLTGYSTHDGSPVVQSWASNGVRAWSVDLPEGFEPQRVAVNNAQCWVVGISPSGTANIIASNIANGAEIWTAEVPLASAYSVCSDGVTSGGCFVGTNEAPETTDSGCAAPDTGPIRRYDSSGNLVAQFGRNGFGTEETQGGLSPTMFESRTTSLLVVGGKLWAGSGGFKTQLCCDLNEPAKPWYGHLARYTFSGSLEILAANPWEPGGGPGSWAAHSLPRDSYVSRIVYANSRLYTAYLQGTGTAAAEMHVSVAEYNPANGRLISAWNLETDDSEDDYRLGVTGMAGDSSNLVIAFDRYSLLWTTLDLNAGTVGGGGLVPALDNSGGLYAAIVNQLCREDQPSADTTTTDAEPGDPCNCSGPTTFGRVNVDCGCTDEDDGVPCSVGLNQSFTGCFANWPGTVTMTLDRTGTPANRRAIWRGEFTVDNSSDCSSSVDPNWSSLRVEVEAIYTCPDTATGSGGGTWLLRYTIFAALGGGGQLFQFSREADSQTCTGSNGYPSFSVTWPTTDISSTVPACLDCSNYGGSGDFGGLAPVSTACCMDTVPAILTATFDNVSGCSGFSGDTVTLTYNSGTSKWEGSGTAGCGDSLELDVYCDSGTWKFDLDSDGLNAPTTGGTFSSATCDPLDLSVTFGITLVDSLSCCPGGGGSTFTITVTE